MVSVSCFGVRVSVMFHFMFVHYTFNSVWVAEWPPFGKWLPARLTICYSISPVFFLQFVTSWQNEKSSRAIGISVTPIRNYSKMNRIEVKLS